MRLTTVLASARPAFLPLTVVCVLLGIALAEGPVSLPLAAWITLGAVAAHVSVNALNEYEDYASGLDLHTRRTPFSGGSGALPADPDALAGVRWLAVASLAIAALVGATIVGRLGAAMLPAGLLGLGLVVTYTRWLNRRPWPCLLAPGTGFGLLMVPATQFALTGVPRPESLLVALVPFLLVNNLLLLNQYPDVAADAAAGRRHVPIVYGPRTANRVYAAQWLGAGVLLVALPSTGVLPPPALLALLPWSAGAYALRGALVHGFRIGEAPRYLAANVIAALLTPLLLALTA